MVWAGVWCRKKIINEWRTAIDTGLETARTCGYIFAIFIGAAMFAFTLKRFGGDALIRAGIGELAQSFGAYQVIAIVLFAIFLLGFVLDWIEITIIILPLIAPAIALMDLGMTGIDQAGLVWFSHPYGVVLTNVIPDPTGRLLTLFSQGCSTERGGASAHLSGCHSICHHPAERAWHCRLFPITGHLATRTSIWQLERSSYPIIRR